MYLCSISNLAHSRGRLRPRRISPILLNLSTPRFPFDPAGFKIPRVDSMLSFIVALWLFVSLPLIQSFSAEIIIRVCQSPGCTDDGGSETLDYLTSLAPPGVRVSKGKCVSLCGAGPVVEVINDGSSLEVKEKKVTGDKLKEMVLGWHESCDGDVLKPYQITGLVQGYEESVQARRAYETKDYEGALELCTFAIQDARKPAMLLQEARDRDSSSGCESNDEELGFPGEMKWLVETFKVSCRCRMALGDVDKARSDAFAATIFSKNSDPGAHECLAEVCKASQDLIGELQALKAAVGQYNRIEELCSKPLPGADAPSRAQNTQRKMKAAARKREIGFRISRLTNELTTS